MNLINSSCLVEDNGKLLCLDAEGDPAERIAVVGVSEYLLAVGKHAEGLDEGVRNLYGNEILARHELLREDTHLLVGRDRLAREVGVEYETELAQFLFLAKVKLERIADIERCIVDIHIFIGTLDTVLEECKLGFGEIDLRALGELGNLADGAGDIASRVAEFILKNLDLYNCLTLLTVPAYENTVVCATGNIASMGIVRSAVIDVYDIMSCDKVLFTKEALDAFIARLA